jgi:FixJ family two-component response regulator
MMWRARDRSITLNDAPGSGADALLERPVVFAREAGHERTDVWQVQRTGLSKPGSEIFIVDDDEMVRDGLSVVFTQAGYRAVSFVDGTSCLGGARERTPACIILDINMPGASGLDVLKELDAATYPAPILILSGTGDVPTAVQAIRHGAFDFVEKRLAAGTIVARVDDALKGWAEVRQRRNKARARSQSFPGSNLLTPREREVLGQITAAASNKEAAHKLGISRRTIEVHRAHIMLKLGARNAADVVRIVLNRKA